MNPLIWVAVMLIGGTGSVLRFLVDRAVSHRARRPFPLGTMAVNVSGAALQGFVAGLALSAVTGLLAGVAFVGAYSTFSTWMLETQRLGEERRPGAAAANIVLTSTLGLGAAAAGIWMAKQW